MAAWRVVLMVALLDMSMAVSMVAQKVELLVVTMVVSKVV